MAGKPRADLQHRVLVALRDGHTTVKAISMVTGLSQSSVDYHLRRLAYLGMVKGLCGGRHAAPHLKAVIWAPTQETVA